MKVKNFIRSLKSEEEQKEFDNEINKFIKDKKIIDVKCSVTSFGYQEPYTSFIVGDVTYSALVMYEEDSDEK